MSLPRSFGTKPVSRWPTKSDRIIARSCRSMPPVRVSPSSPPVRTAVPVGVSARRSRRERRVPGDVDDQVVALRPVGEVVAGVVDDVVGAERADQVELGRAGDAGDLCTGGLCDLYGVAADPTRCADDEDLLPGLDPADVDHGPLCGDRGHRHHGGLLEGEVRRACGPACRRGRRRTRRRSPWLIPNTSSPTENPVTAEPTATTVPATSSPGTGFFGPRKPRASRIA